MADKKKILLVDDEEETLFLLGSILQRHNFEVISTSKGKQAVPLAKESQPDLIILDIFMPDMSGADVAKVLGEYPSTQGIPIIFLTALMTKDETSLGMKTGNHRILAKPTNEQELMSAVSAVFSA